MPAGRRSWPTCLSATQALSRAPAKLILPLRAFWVVSEVSAPPAARRGLVRDLRDCSPPSCGPASSPLLSSPPSLYVQLRRARACGRCSAGGSVRERAKRVESRRPPCPRVSHQPPASQLLEPSPPALPLPSGAQPAACLRLRRARPGPACGAACVRARGVGSCPACAAPATCPPAARARPASQVWRRRTCLLAASFPATTFSSSCPWACAIHLLPTVPYFSGDVRALPCTARRACTHGSCLHRHGQRLHRLPRPPALHGATPRALPRASGFSVLLAALSICAYFDPGFQFVLRLLDLYTRACAPPLNTLRPARHYGCRRQD